MIRNENITHTNTRMHAYTHTHSHKSIITKEELTGKAKKHTDMRGRVRKEEREGEQECLGGNKKKKNPYCENAHMTLVSLPSLFTPTLCILQLQNTQS